MSELLKDCTGVILAGGENRRMPVLKSFLKVNGGKIIEKNLSIFKTLFKENFIVTNQPEIYVHLQTPLLGDVYDMRGPMTGVLTSLLNAPTRWVFVSACDMPYINQDLIRYMADKREGFDTVVPLPRGKTEPLFTFYSNRLILEIEKALCSGKKGLKDFLITKRVKYITTKEIKKTDPKMRSFININTPEDARLFI